MARPERPRNRVRLVAIRHLNYQVIDQRDSSSRNTEIRRLSSLSLDCAALRASSFLVVDFSVLLRQIPRDIAPALASHRIVVSAPDKADSLCFITALSTRKVTTATWIAAL